MVTAVGSGIFDLNHGGPVGHQWVVGIIKGLAEFVAGETEDVCVGAPFVKAKANVRAG